MSRDTIYEYIDLLTRAEIVKVVSTESKSTHSLKNSKILFNSPNIYFAIAHELWKGDVEKGNIRESFFVSQVGGVYPVFTSMVTDFLIMDKLQRIEVEVGGKNKKRKQIKDLDNAYIFKDGIDLGFADSIPLYLAGFLY